MEVTQRGVIEEWGCSLIRAMSCRLPDFAIHGEMAQMAFHTGWYDTKGIYRVELRSCWWSLFHFHHLTIVFLRNSLMLNIPSALLMRRPITSHGAFGAYAYPSSIDTYWPTPDQKDRYLKMISGKRRVTAKGIFSIDAVGYLNCCVGLHSLSILPLPY